MAVQFYVDESAGSYTSGVAQEEIFAGTLVSEQEDGVYLADATNEPTGLALFSEEYMVGEDEDDVVEEKYEEDERVKIAPLDENLRGFARTLLDEGGDAPAISHALTVGLLDTEASDAPDGAAGRLVEEGYENGSTTFEEDNDNFVPVGTAYRPGKQNGETVDGFDTVVRFNSNGQ